MIWGGKYLKHTRQARCMALCCFLESSNAREIFKNVVGHLGDDWMKIWNAYYTDNLVGKVWYGHGMRGHEVKAMGRYKSIW